MKQLIAYYSYTGDTAKLAAELAEKRGCDIAEVKGVHARPGKFKAYTSGSFAAMTGKSWDIQPLAHDPREYDRITVMSPVWAGGPAPQINCLLESMPAGKSVEIILVSASGKSNCNQRLADMLSARGCIMLSLQNMSSKMPAQLE